MTTVPNAYFSLDVYRKRAIFHMKIFKLKNNCSNNLKHFLQTDNIFLQILLYIPSAVIFLLYTFRL